MNQNYQSINASASPEVQMNENFDALNYVFVYAKRHPVTTGLTWGYWGGRWSGSEVLDGTLTLTNAAVNYMVVNTSTGVPSISTSDANWNDSASYARVYKLTTAGGVVTAVEDHRAGPAGIFAGGEGGVGGGSGEGMTFKGVIDCSTNPNYPAANAGDVYKISVAGKIGGASGVNVEVGDSIYCVTDGTAAGDQATVGSSWVAVQANIDGAVTGPTPPVTTENPAVWDGTSGRLVKQMTVSALLDAKLGSTQGQILYRGASSWTVLAPGTAGYFLKSGGAGADVSWDVVGSGGGGGIAAGADKQIQFNDSTAFGGDADFTWDKTTNTITIGSTATPGTIKGGTGASSSTAGSTVNIIAGTGNALGFSSYGGNVNIRGGTNGAEAVQAGNVIVQGGTCTSTNTPGNVYIRGGLSAGGYGGHVYIDGGGDSAGGTSHSYSGDVYVRGGTGSATSGTVYIQGGSPTTFGQGGSVSITAASTINSFSAAGVIDLTAGNSAGNAVGGNVTVTAGNAHATASNHTGGNVLITAGAGGGTAAGGNVRLQPGGAGSTGPFGNIQLDGGRGAALPTTATGGFVTFPTCAGTPTGVPVNVPTGSVATVFDTTGNSLFVYDGAWFSLAGGGGGGAVAGGVDTYVQFNDGGNFGGEADFTWNKTTNVMTLGSTTTPATIKPPTAPASTAGASLTIVAGLAGTTFGNGGVLNLTGGSSNVAGNGGAVNVTGGVTAGSGYTGGAVTVSGGAGYAGGPTTITTGASTSGAASGDLTLTVGANPVANGDCGDIYITGRQGSGISVGSTINIAAGTGGPSGGAGGPINITSGTAPVSGSGGAIILTTGAGTGSVGDDGGSILFRTGAGSASLGGKGNIVVDNLGALATTAVGGFFCIPTCAGTPTGVPLNVPAGSVATVFDSANNKYYIYDGGWIDVSSGVTGADPYVVSAYFPGGLTTSAVIVRIPIAVPVLFAANFAGSYFSATANATGSVVFTVAKNGSSIGTVTIAAGTTTATFATTGGAAQTFVAGDIFSITAPSTVDATLVNVGFAVKATRS